MNEVLKNIYARRSIRAYSEESVKDDLILEIIKAGNHAPTGMNAQPLRFVVITNKPKMKELSDIAKRMFVENLKGGMKEASPEQKAKLDGYISTLQNPNYNIFYDAPVLILIFSDFIAVTPNEDATLAAENMMLAARSMDIGSCWIGFASPLGHNKEVMAELGVPTDHKLIAQLIFGYPKKKEIEPSKRDAAKILKWVH